MNEKPNQTRLDPPENAAAVSAEGAPANAEDQRTAVVRPQRGWSRTFRFVAYWFNLVAQPILAVAAIVGLVFLFGYAQKNHQWFNNARTSQSDEVVEEDAMFACSMLCAFVKAPGRCPVCGMELQKVEPQGDPKDLFGVTIDPTARRLSNIKTVAALNMPISSQSEALGRITYCLLYTSPSPRDLSTSRMPSSA